MKHLQSFGTSSTHLSRTGAIALALGFVLAIIATPLAQAQTFKVIHNFTGGADGAYPKSGLTRDAGGNFYGTTWAGGSGGGNGTIFRLRNFASSWVLTPLYSFTGANDEDGAGPVGGVAIAHDGTLYGSTASGGEGACFDDWGCGTVFHLSPRAQAPKSVLGPWNETVLYRFTWRKRRRQCDR